MANFCTQCGNKLELNDTICSNCGRLIKGNKVVEEVEAIKVEKIKKTNSKNKIVAGLLGVFLGGFGVHNFYLGYYGKAIAQLLITVLSCCTLSFVSSIWGFIEGILILSGNIDKDASGNKLSE